MAHNHGGEGQTSKSGPATIVILAAVRASQGIANYDHHHRIAEIVSVPSDEPADH